MEEKENMNTVENVEKSDKKIKQEQISSSEKKTEKEESKSNEAESDVKDGNGNSDSVAENEAVNPVADTAEASVEKAEEDNCGKRYRGNPKVLPSQARGVSQQPKYGRGAAGLRPSALWHDAT